MAFKEKFLDTMPPVTRNQFILTAVLNPDSRRTSDVGEGTQRYRYDRPQTLDALENQSRCDPNSWTLTFTVVAAVAFIAAVPLAPIEGVESP